MDKNFCTYCMSAVPPGGSCPVCGLTEGSYKPSPHHLPPGTVLQGRYLVGRVLGEGGFGITYIGCDLRLEMKVAIKEYYPLDRSTRNAAVSLEVTGFMGLAARSFERGKQRFLDEARTMARLAKQQVIVGVRDYFEANNTAYIVMEYIEGTTFSELARQRGGRIPPQELFGILEPLFHALSIVHENGLLHRDIAPDNLMLENGKVRLLDFGCAREASQGNETLTITLKHGYAPLEQYQQKGQGPWTDIYALCATIYFCLTGKAPPPALDRIAGDELLLPSKLGVPLSPRQEAVLLKGLAPAPNRRFSTVEELRAALYAPDDGLTDTETVLSDTSHTLQPEETQRTDPDCEPDENKEKTEELSGGFTEESPAAAPRVRKRRATWLIVTAAALLLAILTGLGAALQPQDALCDGTETHLRALLADSQVSAVTLPDGVNLNLTEGGLALTKPLVVEKGAVLELGQELTVADGGLLRVEGSLVNNGLLRASGSGRVEIASTGSLTGESVVWLQSEGNLLVEKGGAALICGSVYGEPGSEKKFVVAAQDAIFADAVHVANWEGFRAAVERDGVSAIVIDRDMELVLDGSWDCCVPLAISEGVTVTVAEGSEGDLVLWNAPLLVNYGVLECPLITGTDAPESANFLLLNFGELRGELFLNCPGSVLNYGSITCSSGQLFESDLYNLGSWTLQGQEDQNWLNLYGRQIINMGDFALTGEDGCWMRLTRGTQFFNNGTLRLSNGAILQNQAILHNNSVVQVEGGGRLENNGWLIANDSEKGGLELDEEAVFGHDGLLMWVDTPPQSLRCQVENTGGRELTWSTAGVRTVTDEAALRAALADDSCTFIQLAEDLTVSGDLTITKAVVTGAEKLVVSGGSLTLQGPSAVLLGSVDLGGGELRLIDGATAACGPENCAAITVENAMLVTELPLRVSGGRISLADSGKLLALRGMVLEAGELAVGEGCAVRVSGEIVLESGSRAELGPQGELLVDNADLLVDGSSVLETSQGSLWELVYTHDGYPRRLEGEFLLSGRTYFSPFVIAAGHLVNEGELEFADTLTVAGTLENRGVLRSLHGAQMEVEDGGVFTGAQPQVG